MTDHTNNDDPFIDPESGKATAAFRNLLNKAAETMEHSQHAKVTKTSRMEKRAAHVSAEEAEKGMRSDDAILGYATMLRAYTAFNHEKLAPEHKHELLRLINIFDGLTAQKHDMVSEKIVSNSMQELKETGETYILSGYRHGNRAHANYARIRKIGDDIFFTIYDGGGTTKVELTEGGKHYGIVQKEYKLLDNNDSTLRGLIYKFSRLKKLEIDSHTYNTFQDDIAGLHEPEPVRSKRDWLQDRGNCSTFGQRLIVRDVLEEAIKPHGITLANDIYDFITNTKIDTQKGINKLEYDIYKLRMDVVLETPEFVIPWAGKWIQSNDENGASLTLKVTPTNSHLAEVTLKSTFGVTSASDVDPKLDLCLKIHGTEACRKVENISRDYIRNFGNWEHKTNSKGELSLSYDLTDKYDDEIKALTHSLESLGIESLKIDSDVSFERHYAPEFDNTIIIHEPSSVQAMQDILNAKETPNQNISDGTISNTIEPKTPKKSNGWKME